MSESPDSFEALSDNNFVETCFAPFGFTAEGLSRRFKYRMTNRDLRVFRSVIGDVRDRRILAVSGSAIPLLTLLDTQRGPPRSVFAFDYSPRQTAFNYLLKYSVQRLTHKQWSRFFGLQSDDQSPLTNRVPLRKDLICHIPRRLRPFLPRRHELTQRDRHFLLPASGVQGVITTSQYRTLQQSVPRLKFFVFNLNPAARQKLSSVFSSDAFDFLYLSNVMDWICWHGVRTHQGLRAVIQTLRDVAHPNAIVVFDHLVSRETVLTHALARLDYDTVREYRLHTYVWRVYRLPLHRLQF